MAQVATTGAVRKRVVKAGARAADHKDYAPLLASVRSRFAEVRDDRPLFTTDARGIFAAFLAEIPARQRKVYDCSACHMFMSRFGGLVSIDMATGRTVPVMWSQDAPGMFEGPVAAAHKLVAKAKVTGPFLTTERVWGRPETPPWRHMAVTTDGPGLCRPTPLKTAGQMRAEKIEEYAMLCRGLADFDEKAVRQALAMLEAEALYRNEKCIGPAKWLLALHEARASVKGATAKANVTWLAVATAPPGFAHVRSTMIGTLLEDIAAGKAFDDIKRAFAAKMHPLQYQRPQAPPSAGNIAQAEKVIATLKSAGALERRYARLDEIETIWRPRAATAGKAQAGGVFAHLKPKDAAGPRDDLVIEGPRMTWEKFARTVLPTADKIEALMPYGSGPFCAYVTAANADAPPILQWDTEAKRNPVSLYFHFRGAPAEAFGLRTGAWVPLTAVSPFPWLWHAREAGHHGVGVLLVLDGCRDKTGTAGNALFPEILKTDYHAVRATIEAYSRSVRIAGEAEASACGLGLAKTGAAWAFNLRVTAGSVVTTHVLDRWD